jgi:hypothetical protein
MGKWSVALLSVCVLAWVFLIPCAAGPAVSKQISSGAVSPAGDSRSAAAPACRPDADEDGDEDEDSDSAAGLPGREFDFARPGADHRTAAAPAPASWKSLSAGADGDEDEDTDEEGDAGNG